jgi:hypothetical protein
VYKAIFIPFALAMSLFGLLLVLNGCFVLQPLLKIIVLGVFAVVIYGLSMLATKQMTISKNFHFQLCGI